MYNIKQNMFDLKLSHGLPKGIQIMIFLKKLV